MADAKLLVNNGEVALDTCDMCACQCKMKVKDI